MTNEHGMTLDTAIAASKLDIATILDAGTEVQIGRVDDGLYRVYDFGNGPDDDMARNGELYDFEGLCRFFGVHEGEFEPYNPD